MGKTIISWATQTVNVVTGCSKPAAVTSAGLDILGELADWAPDFVDLKRTVQAIGRQEFAQRSAVEKAIMLGIDKKWLRSGTSPECIRCYAEFLSLRRGWSDAAWTESHEDRNVHLKPERFKEFKRIPVKDPRLPPSQRERFFVCSMGDIFHRLVPDAFLHQLFDIMRALPHIYMLLTKRPDRAASWPGPWPDNVWLGTTCGHPITKWRIEYLRRSKAKTRFVSAEPLLDSLLPLNLDGIHQVIVGGESGSGFRPMKMDWAREVRDACGQQRTAFFFKQDAAYQTEKRPWLVEEDGLCREYKQYPGELSEPFEMHPRRAELTVLG